MNSGSHITTVLLSNEQRNWEPVQWRIHGFFQVCQSLVWWEEYSSHIGSYNAITLGRQSLRRTSGGMKWNLPTGSKMTQLLGCLLDASHLAWSTYLLPDVQFKTNSRNTRINRIFFFSFWKCTLQGRRNQKNLYYLSVSKITKKLLYLLP